MSGVETAEEINSSLAKLDLDKKAKCVVADGASVMKKTANELNFP